MYTPSMVYFPKTSQNASTPLRHNICTAQRDASRVQPAFLLQASSSAGGNPLRFQAQSCHTGGSASKTQKPVGIVERWVRGLLSFGMFFTPVTAHAEHLIPTSSNRETANTQPVDAKTLGLLDLANTPGWICGQPQSENSLAPTGDSKQPSSSDNDTHQHSSAVATGCHAVGPNPSHDKGPQKTKKPRPKRWKVLRNKPSARTV